MGSLQFSKTLFQKNFHVITVELHQMSLDKSSLKIDLESIIGLKTPLMIDSEFWDRYRALGNTNCQNSKWNWQLAGQNFFAPVYYGRSFRGNSGPLSGQKVIYFAHCRMRGKFNWSVMKCYQNSQFVMKPNGYWVKYESSSSQFDLL